MDRGGLVRLVSYVSGDGSPRVGILEDDEVRDTGVGSLFDVFSMSPDELGALAAITLSSTVIPLSHVRLEAPLRPRKNVFAVGRNYLEHVRERPGADSASRPPPEVPIIFSKPPTSIIGPGEAIDTSNDPSSTTDYEGELAVVIGTGGKRIERERAMDHVFGYTLLNDVTAREYQRSHGQWLMGKGPDTFCPLGPSVLTADAVPDVTALAIETRVNDELRQSGLLSQLIFDIPTLISTISSVMTLDPGDVIATGTPSGVGAFLDPPKFLQPGDVVSVTVEEIGTLTNPVV
jgi:2-keto-4-pentenoate hydratase/2-oxohepta-3-ene-1,7-dioic acid hydratase in catechol pathway